MRVSLESFVHIVVYIVPHTGPVRTSRDLVVHVPNKSPAFAKAAVTRRPQIKNILVDRGNVDRKGVFEGRPSLGWRPTTNIVQQGPGMGRV